MNSQIVVRFKLMSWYFLILPITLLMVVCDLTILGESLKEYLSTRMELSSFILFLASPHVISSYFPFADKDYYEFYFKRLFIVLLLFIFILSFSIHKVGLVLFMDIITILAIYHGFVQQIGITSLALRRIPDFKFLLWKRLALFIIVGIYVVLMLVKYFPNLNDFKSIFFIVIGCSILLFIFTSYSLFKECEVKEGRKYLILNSLLTVSVIGFYKLGYLKLIYVMNRIIHDLTAFTIYMAHDHNRFLDGGKNYIYKIATKLKIPVAYACPLFSFLIAGALYISFSELIYVQILFVLSYYHYSIETFVWKRGSLHRRYVQFTS